MTGNYIHVTEQWGFMVYTINKKTKEVALLRNDGRFFYQGSEQFKKGVKMGVFKKV
jgi:hypothetical protein